jgi:hypothetical protein
MFRVGISSAEPWNLWCSFQDPIYSEGYGWACTVRSSRGSGGVGLCRVEDDRGQSFEYPSWKCHACGTFIPEVAVCSCTAAGCWFNQTPTDTYELVLIDDGVLSGPDPNCGDCTVRLERVE